MSTRSKIILVTVLVLALLATATTAFADDPKISFSGQECVYVAQPGQVDFGPNTMTITGQVNVTQFHSDNPAVFPNGTNTATLNIWINTITMQAIWRADAVFVPDDGSGAWLGKGEGQIDLLTGASKGVAVFHGTGANAGKTMWQDLSAGNKSLCPGAPFDATHWTGFIAPK